MGGAINCATPNEFVTTSDFYVKLAAKGAKTMSDQEFKERVLSAIEDLKRTTERIEGRLTGVENRFVSVEKDVAWIKGKLEGRQESLSNKNVRSALWIALGSALAAIISLIKSFW